MQIEDEVKAALCTRAIVIAFSHSSQTPVAGRPDESRLSLLLYLCQALIEQTPKNGLDSGCRALYVAVFLKVLNNERCCVVYELCLWVRV